MQTSKRAICLFKHAITALFAGCGGLTIGLWANNHVPAIDGILFIVFFAAGYIIQALKTSMFEPIPETEN